HDDRWIAFYRRVARVVRIGRSASARRSHASRRRGEQLMKRALLSVVILSVGGGAGACADAKPEEHGRQAQPQLVDRTRTPNDANEGIAKSLEEQIGAGRGDVMTPRSSAFIITRDPFRAIRRGRQLFQRKFTR